MENNQFYLQWNNHNETLIRKIKDLKNKTSFADVTLACNGQYFHLHKFVLASCSEYFEELLLSTDSKFPMIVLTDIQPNNLEKLLTFMYLGEVYVQQTELDDLVKTANCLKIRGLTDEDNIRILEENKKRKRSLSHKKRNIKRLKPNHEGLLQTDKDMNQSKPGNELLSNSLSSTENSINQELHSNSTDASTISINIVKKEDNAEILEQNIKLDDEIESLQCEPLISASDLCETSTHWIENNNENILNTSPSEASTSTHWIENNNENMLHTFSEAVGKKKFACTYCAKSYNRKDSWILHMRTHTGERPYDCPHCDRRFTNLSDRKKHIRIHTGERPFICPICNQGFARSSDMKKHYNKHGEDSPTKCPRCETSFPTESDMRKHLRTHVEERPHVCPHCDQRFHRLDVRDKHVRIHTGEKPFICDMCDYCSSRKDSLRHHMLSKHSNNKKK